jgi:hypothetical protein
VPNFGLNIKIILGVSNIQVMLSLYNHYFSKRRLADCFVSENHSGFGGLEVACWRLEPKFAGSNAFEAVGFFQGEKLLSTPSFRK